MVIVLPLRRSSLRKMIQDGHSDRQINLRVLKSLRPIVCSGLFCQHGDLKEKCDFQNNNCLTLCFRAISITPSN